MSITTANIATVQAGFCDACEQPYFDGEFVREFVFTPRGGSFVLQYATCFSCHQMREDGAVSAPPVRVLVSGRARIDKTGSTLNSSAMRCTPDMAEFLSRSAIEVRFQDEVTAA